MPCHTSESANFFLSGLVVHDADVELAAVLPAVHAVGRAGENKFVLAAADADRRQIGVVLVGKIQLKVERAEVRAAQLLRRVEHDAPRCLRQTSEEIDEPGALFPKILQLRAHIFADVFVRQRGDGLVVRFGKAAALDTSRATFSNRKCRNVPRSGGANCALWRGLAHRP